MNQSIFLRGLWDDKGVAGGPDGILGYLIDPNPPRYLDQALRPLYVAYPRPPSCPRHQNRATPQSKGGMTSFQRSGANSWELIRPSPYSLTSSLTPIALGTGELGLWRHTSHVSGLRVDIAASNAATASGVRKSSVVSKNRSSASCHCLTRSHKVH